MRVRVHYRLSRDNALTILCALADWNNSYLSQGRGTADAPRALFCARQADDGVMAYCAIVSRYGWNEHHRAQVKRWREAISDLRITAARGTGNEAR